jgi:hypothetical protein
MLEAKGLINLGLVAGSGIYYNWSRFMHSAITLAVRLLEGIFGIGMAGTVLVLIRTGIEDLQTILQELMRSGN